MNPGQPGDATNYDAAGVDYWGDLGNHPLKVGQHGYGVAAVQERMTWTGMNPGRIDGKYGPKTADAVRKFQAGFITIDGIFGEQSRALYEEWHYKHGRFESAVALTNNLRKGDAGGLVTNCQHRLKDRGWNLAVDGHFGPQTQKIVLAFQTEKTNSGFDTGGVDCIIGNKTYGCMWLAKVT